MPGSRGQLSLIGSPAPLAVGCGSVRCFGEQQPQRCVLEHLLRRGVVEHLLERLLHPQRLGGLLKTVGDVGVGKADLTR